MSEASTSDIDCNDLLNQIGLGTNENKDENNKKETKKKKKVRSNKKNQNQPNKSKQPLMNLAEFINPKNSDFQTDEDLSNNKNVFDITNDENEVKSTEIKEPQKVVNSQISTDFDDIRSYSSTTNENNNTKSDKKIELQNNEQISQDEVREIENIFNIDSGSDSDDKKEEKNENTQKEETKVVEVQEEQQPKKEEEEKKVDDNPQKTVKTSKKNNNKIKKNLTRINLSQYLDVQSQNSNDEFKNDLPKSKVDVEPKKEEKKLVKEDLNKLNRQTSEIERRISDYLNLSIKKVISDFTTELTTLLNQSDSFDETIRRYISDFKKNILNSIDFSQNDTTFSNSDFNSIDISPTNDFKDLYRDISDILPIKPENYLSAFAECQSKIQTTKNFLNRHISPLVSEMHNEVYKSAKRTKLKVKKFKLNRYKYSVYDKLYDLEKREFEYQIESHISEIKRKGSFYAKTSSPVSPSSISFFEEDSITDRMRTFSMTPSKSDLYKEIEGIIRLLKVRRKKTTTNMNLNLSISSVADSSLSTSFFPISPSQMQEDFQIHEPSTGKQFFYSKIIKEIGQSKEESRTLRQTFQRKIQEFNSASSLLMMEYQTQISRQQQQQQQAFAASISLLQTNPQNYFTQTVPVAASNETNLNTNFAVNNNKNSRTSALLQFANEDDFENEELLNTLRQQADEMNRKMVDELNSTTAFIKKISRSTRRHSVSHTHHHRHHRHSRIDPDPSMQKRKLELSSDISLSNMSDDNKNISSKIEKKRDNNSTYLDNQKLQIRKNTKNNIQDDFNIKKHQDVRRRKNSSKH